MSDSSKGTSSSGCPLASRYRFKAQLFRRPPRLVNTAITRSVSSRMSRSISSPTSAVRASAPVPGEAAGGGPTVLRRQWWVLGGNPATLRHRVRAQASGGGADGDGPTSAWYA